jgi:hypothetical protein
MRMGHFTLRFLNQMVLIFSIFISLLITGLLLPQAGTLGLIVWGILFVIIYLGIAKLFDICFKIPK